MTEVGGFNIINPEFREISLLLLLNHVKVKTVLITNDITNY